MGIMLGAGAWPTEARRSGWMCASASSLARGRATSCEDAARTSYPFGGRDGGPRGSRALGLEADGAGSWFWSSSS